MYTKDFLHFLFVGIQPQECIWIITIHSSRKWINSLCYLVYIFSHLFRDTRVISFMYQPTSFNIQHFYTVNLIYNIFSSSCNLCFQQWAKSFSSENLVVGELLLPKTLGRHLTWYKMFDGTTSKAFAIIFYLEKLVSYYLK